MSDREQRHAELARHYLPDDRLKRFRDRADDYDRHNGFPHEDLAELTEAGYLRLFVPEDHGGPGLTLNQVSRLQQRLAGASPSTALAINMHLLCLGVARAMSERGDSSLEPVFTQAMAGEIFAFGVSEPGNDWVLQGSTTTATPTPEGGYTLTGVKIFTSLAPVWTRLLVHGLDETDPQDPRLVYGFLNRSDHVATSDDWDVLGMRATQSRATILTDAPMVPTDVARRIPTGPHPDLMTFAITANFQLLVASVYAGIADRALTLATEGLRGRHSAKHDSRYADVPEYRARLADALRDYLPVPAQLDACTKDLDELADHGATWPLRLVSARLNASTIARRTVETALICSGGAGYSTGHELNRLHRDVTASLFHPPGADAARPMYAAALLDDDPSWPAS